MSHPELPDQFVDSRKGPWPQPSPSHPLICADEVLHLSLEDEFAFDKTIGLRYAESLITYQWAAAEYVRKNQDWTGVDDARFNEIMFTTIYTKFLKPLSPADVEKCKKNNISIDANTRKYDFTGMDLLEPLAGTYCAATVLIINNSGNENYTSVGVFVNEVCIKPENSSWGLAKLYVLQGAAYHVLFVVHPAIHFPLDSVNAITRSAVPIAHPLFQLLHPHSCYQLALDNAVLEGARSVVNNDAKGTRYDPLTANGYNLKLLFGAGYTGLPAGKYNNAYPVYDYMQPQMGFASDYGRWLAAYFEPFLKFTTVVAEHIRSNPHLHEYARRWGHYNHAHVLGFPEAQQMQDRDTLAKAMAIFMWDASVAHGADHWSFSNQISVVEKCLRIRRPPPKSVDEPPVTQGDIFSKNDLKRAAVCQHLFFEPWAIKPNLSETRYAFTDNELEAAANTFQQELAAVSQRTDIRQFMPLTAQDDYKNTIPQSIQY